MFKKRICLVVTLIMFFCTGLVGCFGENYNKEVYTSEFFLYQNYGLRNMKSDRDKVEIRGLTDLGREQKILVIPEQIDGKTVMLLGSSALWGGPAPADFASETLEKIFFPVGNIKVAAGTFNNCKSLKKFIVLYYDKSLGYSTGIVSNSGGITVYVIGKMESFEGDAKYQPANTTYYFNFETEINEGVYWIDDITYGEKIEYLPENPIREGYEFAGWYNGN